MQVLAHLLAPDGAIPNHPRWPLLVYPAAVQLSGADPAAIFEQHFARNRWPAAWRNGVFPFHHYHSDGHEALGVYPRWPCPPATRCMAPTVRCSTTGNRDQP